MRLTDVDQGSRNTHTTYDADGYVQSVRDALDLPARCQPIRRRGTGKRKLAILM